MVRQKAMFGERSSPERRRNIPSGDAECVERKAEPLVPQKGLFHFT
jgi:hypothetical protein